MRQVECRGGKQVKSPAFLENLKHFFAVVGWVGDPLFSFGAKFFFVLRQSVFVGFFWILFFFCLTSTC